MARRNKAGGPAVARSYVAELRAGEGEGGEGVIEGRPIVYGSKTDIGGMFEEVIAEGALDGADLKDVRFLVNHNTEALPLARSRNNNGNSTMRLIPDEKGLSVRVRLDIANNPDAMALYSAVQRGDVSGMSFMFSVGSESWEGLETDYPSRTVESIASVYEVSAVTWPAYEATEISARDSRALEGARAALESARAMPPDGGAADLELEKLKAHYLYGI